jgi:capsular polysaccharide biosynthesis protein
VDVPRPMFYGELVPGSINELPSAVDIPEPTVSVADDVVLVTGHLFVDRRSGTVLPQSRGVSIDSRALAGLATRPPHPFRPSQQAQGEVFVVDCHFTDNYGHNLLEALPRLMLLDRVPAGIQIATSIPRSRDHRQSDRWPRDRSIAGALLRGAAVLPARLSADRLVHLERSLHPLAREAFTRWRLLGNASKVERAERIFISRSRIRRRRLVNEAEIEAIFERRGFRIVHPEQLLIEDQIALFSTAGMIAGLGGSAMHSTVFSPPETKVLLVSSIEWFVKMDVLISQRAGQLGYVFGEPTDDAVDAGDRTWRVDPAAVEAAIVAHFGL